MAQVSELGDTLHPAPLFRVRSCPSPGHYWGAEEWGSRGTQCQL